MTLHGIYCKDVPLGDKETKVQTGQVTCPGPHPKMRARIQVSPFPTAWTLRHTAAPWLEACALEPDPMYSNPESARCEECYLKTFLKVKKLFIFIFWLHHMACVV